MEQKYRAITGRVFDLAGLPNQEREFLDKVYEMYQKGASWADFSRKWVSLGRAMLWGRDTIPMRRTACRVCQDLAVRIGIAEGRVAQPDYRECLADLIDDRFKSRYEFCHEAGIDQSQLSRVLSGRANFSSEMLIGILELCGLPSSDVFGAAFGVDEASAKMEGLQRKIDALKTVKARSENFPKVARQSLLGQRDLMPHPLDGLRLRVEAGEELGIALNVELAKAYEELSALAAKVKDEADRGREAIRAC